jgi:hypothetical protein
MIKSRMRRWTEHKEHMMEMRNVYKILDGKPKRKRPLIRPKHRWDTII